MAVKTFIEQEQNGRLSIVFKEDGSGDLNRIMGELCKKHREARERGEDDSQTETEICQEILQAISEDDEATLDAELDAEDID